MNVMICPNSLSVNKELEIDTNKTLEGLIFYWHLFGMKCLNL